MSARRRRAALSALGALLAAFFCAVLASSVDGHGRRLVLIVLSLAWLVVTAFCVVNVLRTEQSVSPSPQPPLPPAAEVGSDEPA
jgi:uncharacterized membrane protein YfcA